MKDSEMLLYNSLLGTHLLERAPKRDVVCDLLGLQAQFARNPQYSLWLRASDYAPATWDDGLVKIWSHRGTMHVINGDELGLYLSAAGYTDESEFTDNWWRLTIEEQQQWTPFISEQVLSGNDTRDGLKAACRSVGMDEDTLGKVFHGWGGLIKEMTWRGKLVCCTGTDKRYAIPEPPRFIERDIARRILLRRYFDTFGPATVQDCSAFFNYGTADTHALLEELLPTLSVTKLGRKTYYHSRPLITDAELPECVLLPGFDQMVLAYRERSRFIAKENLRKVVNVAGIVFPLAIVRGMARARWRLDGDTVYVTPFERLYKKDEAAIKRAFKRDMGVAVALRAIKRVEFIDQ